MQSFDRIVTTQLHTYVSTTHFLTDIAIFFAGYSQYLLGFIAAALIVYKIQWLRVVVLALIASLIARYVVKELILLYISRARPFVEYSNIYPLINSRSSQNYESFPSGHALFFFAFATVVYSYHKKWGVFFFVVVTLMGIARIAVGVHYLTDIIAGAFLGILTTVGVLFFSRKQKMMKRSV